MVDLIEIYCFILLRMIIEFPQNQIKVRKRNGRNELFDPIRKRWFLMTPEEWVRQHWIQFLINSKAYPASMIAIEKEIKLGELKKRCDVVVYDKEAQPFIIIECKEPDTPLSTKTVDQILRYHISLPAPYLIISNGVYTLGYVKENNRFLTIDNFPQYGS